MSQKIFREPAVILAAGQSSRFWPLNQKHKSLLKIMGRPLIYYTLVGLKKAGFRKIIIVQGPGEEIRKELNLSGYPASLKIDYVIQPKPVGMGEALWRARKFLSSYFFVLNAERVDVDEIIKNSGFQLKLNRRKKPFLFGQKTNNPELFGLAQLRGDKVVGVVEKPQKGREPSKIRILGLYFLSPDFFDFYRRVSQKEYNFEEALSLYAREKELEIALLEKDEEVFSLKYPWHLLTVRNYLMDRFLENKIAGKAKVAKKAVIEGKVFVGQDSVISAGAFIKGPVYIGQNCFVGNNSIVRDYSDIENQSVIGGLSEVTRSIFQENVHTHSGFFGDSIFDRGSRVGAGTVTANVRIDRKEIFSRGLSANRKISTGMNSLGIITGENVKIGINCSLMPGKLIGSDCLIGPSSLVIKNIKNGHFFYTRHKENENKRWR